MKVSKDKSNSANAAFWESVEKIADEVRQWPAWKKGQIEAAPNNEQAKEPQKSSEPRNKSRSDDWL
jgi:hypothetical protein